MIIYCGKCGKKLLPDDSAAGKVGVCAGCKAKIPIPKSSGKKGPLCLFCPECEAKLGAPITLAGKDMTCPKCQTKIELPELEKKKGDTPGSKIIDSGLFNLEEVEELRKIPFPPPPSAEDRSGKAAEDAVAERSGIGLGRPLIRTVVSLAIVLLVLAQFIREAMFNLEVAEARRLAAEEKFHEAVKTLDSVIAHGPLTVAKWRAAKLRPELDRSARAKDAYEAAMEFVSKNPEDLSGALALLSDAAEKFGHTVHGDHAADKAKGLEAKIDALAAPLHEKLLAKGKELVFDAKFDEAKHLFDSFPQELLSSKWQQKCSEARQRIADMTELVRKQLAKGAALHEGRLVTGDHKKQMEKDKFEQEQRVKGLVEFEGKWIAKEEKEQIERERIEKSRRETGMVQLHRDKWISKEERDRRDRRALIESDLPNGSLLVLNEALTRAGMSGTTDADKTECGYLLRAKCKVDTRPKLSSPEVGTLKVTVTLTVCRLTIENPTAPREQLVIKEEELFTLSEAGRKSLARKDGTGQSASAEVTIAAMEPGAVENALSFLEHKLTAKLQEVTGQEPEQARRERAEAALKSLRFAKSDGARQKAVDKLVEVGTAAVPVMLEALDDRDVDVRLWLVGALGKVGDASALSPLRKIQVKAQRREEGADVGKAAGEAIMEIMKRNKLDAKQDQ